MFARLILYPLLAILLITLLRYVIGLIGKAFTDQFMSRHTARPGSAPGRAQAGELKRDPVCGTYVAASTSVKMTVRGEVLHFCSEACRDKFAAR